MIAIINVSDVCKPFGVHKYEVRINKTLITTFEHRREQGLVICLRQAAAAVEKVRWQEIMNILNETEKKE